MHFTVVLLQWTPLHLVPYHHPHVCASDYSPVLVSVYTTLVEYIY